jgi:superfamily I DNA/RNA helicase
MRTDDFWISKLEYYSSVTDLKNKLNDTTIRMENNGIERKDITILVCERLQLTELISSNPHRYAESAFIVPGKINVSTIHAYKGLENKFILICGPQNYDPNDNQQMSLIFIANTRAAAQSIFFLDKRFDQIIINRISN